MTENSGSSVRVVIPSADQGDGDCVHVGDEEGDDREEDKEEEAALKKMISDHPLYGLLLESHINCLKVCSSERGAEIGTTSTSTATPVTDDNANIKPLEAALVTYRSSSDLDQFMEAFCNALNQLKEAMENPLKEASSFIDSVHAQLEELTATSNESKQQGENQPEPSIVIK